MEKWIKALFNHLSKLLAVEVPGLRTGSSKVQECSIKTRLARTGVLNQPFPRRILMGGSKRKLRSVWNQRNPNLFTCRVFSNLGSLAGNQFSSATKARSLSSLFQNKVRSMYHEPWMMSDEEVLDIISKHECAEVLNRGIVSNYESNQLPSNKPVEDRRFVSTLLYDSGALLVGVLDGHGGDTCAHNVSQRLSDYIGAALLPTDVLVGSTVKKYLFSKHFLVCNNPGMYNFHEDPVCHENLKGFFMDLRRIQKRLHTGAEDSPTLTHLKESRSGYQTAITETREEEIFHTMTAISKAFLRLDRDLSQEAFTQGQDKEGNEHKLKSISSGACALVVHIKGTELTVANCGDCRAVLGVQSEDGLWSALQLSNDHTAGNPSEVQRVLNEHPVEEAYTCLRSERLLGRLAPLRAFGDAKFKWSKRKQEKVFQQKGLAHLSDFHTPPYLTAEPEVTSYQLQRSDKFLILASDGLWDMLSNEEAVDIVRENLKRRNPGSSIVYQRQESADDDELKSSCELENAASCLIKEALGGADHVSVTMSLSIPFPDVRRYRDDITVTVVHFDWSNVAVE